MYAENEIFFPYHVIPLLKNLRGAQWEALVTRVEGLSEYHDEVLAFVLMMIRLNGCLGCETDSYRAMRGCHACVVQTLRRYKGSDDELIEQYQTALADVRQFAQTHKQIPIIAT